MILKPLRRLFCCDRAVAQSLLFFTTVYNQPPSQPSTRGEGAATAFPIKGGTGEGVGGER
jgi:hypothetical protein